MIKFLDIYNQDKRVHKNIINDIKKLITKGDFILGSAVNEFEKNFSKFCGSKYAISCANGTDAITLALKSLYLPKNSEVIIKKAVKNIRKLTMSEKIAEIERMKKIPDKKKK